MSETKHTPGPWRLEEYDEYAGYDCMTGGIRVGPVTLDGADYGQTLCAPISEQSLACMQKDARLIAAAPDLLVALIRVKEWCEDEVGAELPCDSINAALAKAGVK